MHQSSPRPLLCDRTREWVALRLDAELSDFETALMTAHLERCAECRAFGEDVAAITSTLRAAPLETLEHPITLPARERLPFRRLPLIAAAAVVLVAAALGGVWGAIGSSPPRATATPPVRAPMLATAPDAFLRDLRVLALRQSATRSLGASKPVLRASA
jgi:ferric-dicitrate binding protein FerR (iron transport regulator)